MAQRSSRSRKAKTRSAGTKKAHLRDPQVREGATRQERRSSREKQRAQEAASSSRGPLVRMRPAGLGGGLVLAVGGAIIVALVLAAAWALGRAWVFGYPDSLWLFAAVGAVAAAPAIGFVARRPQDVQLWAAVSGMVALGALAAEISLGPKCPATDCGSVGARGYFGAPLSAIVVAVLALAAWQLGVLTLNRARLSRPRGGVRTTIGAASGALAMLGILTGLPIAGIFLLADISLRVEPSYAQKAFADVRSYCFDLNSPERALALRPVGSDAAPFWTSFYVRLAHDHRGLPGKATLPTNLLKQADPTPYEAEVTYNRDDGSVFVECRMINPTDHATKANLAPIADTNVSQPLGLSTDNPLNANVPGGTSPEILTNPSAAGAGNSTLPAGLASKLPAGVHLGSPTVTTKPAAKPATPAKAPAKAATPAKPAGK
jgi:hypothetical protein